MIDISFVQDNLPTPEEQLELLAQHIKNNTVVNKFNLVSEVDRTKKLIFKVGGETKLDANKNKYPDFESKKNHLAFKVESVIRRLGICIVTFYKKRQELTSNILEINILKPEALLEKTYISFVEREEEIYLVGIVGIYFDN